MVWEKFVWLIYRLIGRPQFGGNSLTLKKNFERTFEYLKSFEYRKSRSQRDLLLRYFIT